jgi:hypothetical protein
MSLRVGGEDMTILPKTTLGKWSAILAASFVFLLFLLIWVEDPSPGPGRHISFFMSLIIIYGPALILASFITGLISIIKSKERSLLVILGLLIPIVLEVMVISVLGG